MLVLSETDMDFNQSISSLLENEKDLLVISDLTKEVVLPEIAKTCTYGKRFTEVDIDGNIVSQGDVSSCDSDPGTPTLSKVNHSPQTDASEIIPQSPVFTSSTRRGSRKHQRMRSRRSQDMMTKPLFSEKSNADNDSATCARLDSLDSPLPEVSDLNSHEAAVTPGLRMAASLGCELEAGSPAWLSSLETPGGQGRPDSDEEAIKPGEKKLSPKSLFTETSKDAAVININRGDLLEMASDEEEAVDTGQPNGLSSDSVKNLPPPDPSQNRPHSNRDDLLKIEFDGEKAVDTGLSSKSVKNMDLPSPDQSPNPPFIGFKTGGGRNIGISEEALAKAKLKMEKITEDRQQKVQQSNIFNIGSEKLKCISEPKVSAALGFTTGSGKRITVSDTALKEAKSILGNNFEAIYDTKKLPQDQEVSVSDKISKISNDKENKGIDEFKSSKDFNSYSCEQFVGFKTAKGSKIHISEDALQKAKIKLNNEEITPQNFTGFKTAKGSNINISEDALQKAKIKLNNDEITLQNFTGFKTAKGSNINISKDALQKAKIKLNNDDINPQNFTGFKTAKGSNINISEDALHKAKIKLNKDEITPQNLPFEGFQTAKGAKISVSKEALAKAKLTLETENSVKTNNPPACGMSGFSTAGGGKISISSEALNKVKNIFNDDSLMKQFTMPSICPRTPEKVVDTCQDDEFDSEDDKFLLEACSVPDKESNNVNPGAGDFSTCRPSDEQFKMSPFQCGPDFMDEFSEQANGFHVPTSNNCDVSEERIDLDVIFGTKRKLEEVEIGNENPSVSFKREAARKKQKNLIEGKAKKQIRPIPGKLVDKRTIDRQKREKLQDLDMDWSASPNMSWEAAEHFVFEGQNYFSTECVRNNTSGVSLGDGILAILSEDGCLGVAELESAFLASPGVDPKLVPDGWFRNHYRWIVWTLSSYQSRCSDKQIFLTPQNVMSRMKYRYDREIDRSERSVLRRVLEQDDSAGVTMVLCVTWISGDQMSLSDGWYHLNSPLYQGSLMQRLVSSGKIKVGSKLITQGAEIIGTQAGTPCHPLGKLSFPLIHRFKIIVCHIDR